ncbi:hypothetical protein, partial [Paenibacillus sp.]
KHLNEQLYYSINAIRLVHPPLAERSGHTRQVITQLLDQLCEKHDRQITLPEESLTFLMHNHWIAGFHSIRTLLEQFFLYLQADVWQPSHFQSHQHQKNTGTINKPIIVNTIFPLKEAVNAVEKELLLLLMEKNISYRQMAKILDVNPSTIIRKIRKMEVDSYDY